MALTNHEHVGKAVESLRVTFAFPIDRESRPGFGYIHGRQLGRWAGVVAGCFGIFGDEP
jgi:hypothetical protein